MGIPILVRRILYIETAPRTLSGLSNSESSVPVYLLQHGPCASLEEPNTAVMAQQVAQMRQGGGRTIAMVAQGLPWSPNGGTVVATVIAQWTLLVGQRRHNGDTMEAEASLKLTHNVHNRTHFYGATTVPPFCDHSDASACPSSCLR